VKSERKTTIYDVAQETGLSIATISRVMNDKGGYSRKTEQLVKDAIEKLSFTPNSTAKNLASNSNKTIGLSLSFYRETLSTPGDYLIQFLQGVTLAAMKFDYNILLDNHIVQDYVQKHTIGNRNLYEGIIFSNISRESEPLIGDLIDEGFPVVYAGSHLDIDENVRNIYGGFSDYKREVLEMLYETGHRRIAVLESYSSVQFTNITICENVVSSFLKDHELDNQNCRLVIYDSSVPNQFMAVLSTILEQEDLPDAIYADSLAGANMTYSIINKYGLRIPEDISVVSSVHLKQSGLELLPPLSTCFFNALEMGKRSVELLVSQIKRQEEEPGHFVPYEIIMRESVRDRSV